MEARHAQMTGFSLSDNPVTGRAMRQDRPPMHLPDSSNLFERIAKQDRAAVIECIDKHGALVWAISRKFTPSTAEAEQLAAEVFAAIWQQSHRCDSSKFTDTGFIMIVARACIALRRHVNV
ncbi:MAG: sigma factor [Pyrinomonadaceae bacterium]